MIELNTIPHVTLFGIDVFKLTMRDLLELCESRIQNRERLLLGVVNVAKLVNARKDIDLRRSIQEADVVLADGQGVAWLSRWLGDPVPERVAGIDIMIELIRMADRRHLRIFFLGASKDVVSRVVACVQKLYPGVQIAGRRDGYFDLEREGPAIAEEIRASNADILFVAMPSPKKENFLRLWIEEMKVPVCHGVGGSFDVLAGVVRRAPHWMQRAGLEWLYRVIQEPRRMWRRYLITNSKFLALSLWEIIRCRLLNRAVRHKPEYHRKAG